MTDVTGIVLAGGQGRRMGGVDKGLQLLHGKPMVAQVLARLAPQVSEIVINANQNLEAYAGFGHRVVPDAIGGFAGPLAGLHAGLGAAKHALVLTVPCDSPFLPADLFSQAGKGTRAKMNSRSRKRGTSRIRCFHWCGLQCLIIFRRFLSAGGRKIDAWYSTLKVIEVPFDDEADAFRNINTREELKEA